LGVRVADVTRRALRYPPFPMLKPGDYVRECLRPISRENGSEGVQEGAWAKTSKGDALQRGRRSCSRSGARRSPGNSARPARLATTAQCKPQAHLGRATGEKRSPTVLRGGLRKADATAAERTRRQGGCVRPGVVRV